MLTSYTQHIQMCLGVLAAVTKFPVTFSCDFYSVTIPPRDVFPVIENTKVGLKCGSPTQIIPSSLPLLLHSGTFLANSILI